MDRILPKVYSTVIFPQEQRRMRMMRPATIFLVEQTTAWTYFELYERCEQVGTPNKTYVAATGTVASEHVLFKRQTPGLMK